MRSHVTDTKLVLPLGCVDPTSSQSERPYGKPRGFWYELDGDWRRWCEENEFQTRKHNFLYDVDTSDCRMRVIASLEEALQFSVEFRSDEFRSSGFPEYHMAVDWGRAVDGFDGIEMFWHDHYATLIEPRLSWMSTWDCRSGCIWNASKARVTLAKVLVDTTWKEATT